MDVLRFLFQKFLILYKQTFKMGNFKVIFFVFSFKDVLSAI